MHELSIVQALLEQVESEVDQAGAGGRIRRLQLSIGRLSGVHSDSIRFAFELLTPGTRLEGAQLDIDEPRAICVCGDCGARTEIEELFLDCPICRGSNITLDGGQEMLLETIDVEDE